MLLVFNMEERDHEPQNADETDPQSAASGNVKPSILQGIDSADHLDEQDTEAS